MFTDVFGYCWLGCHLNLRATQSVLAYPLRIKSNPCWCPLWRLFEKQGWHEECQLHIRVNTWHEGLTWDDMKGWLGCLNQPLGARTGKETQISCIRRGCRGEGIHDSWGLQYAAMPMSKPHHWKMQVLAKHAIGVTQSITNRITWYISHKQKGSCNA